MRRHIAAILMLLAAGVLDACTRVEGSPDASMIARDYGVSGAVPETITTDAGPVQGTLVPITLADGTHGQLFVPLRQSRDVEAVYLRDAQGLHPVQLASTTTREELVRAPAIATSRPARATASKRSWEREVLIVAGSAGAGAAIGGLAAGKKGAGVGAAAGGVGGLVYDLLTRRRR